MPPNLLRELPPAVLLDQTTRLLEKQAALIDALQEAVLTLRAERDEARQIQAKLDAILHELQGDPRMREARVFAPRICRECRSSFVPNSGNQVVCLHCKPVRILKAQRAWVKRHPRHDAIVEPL